MAVNIEAKLGEKEWARNTAVALGKSSVDESLKLLDEIALLCGTRGLFEAMYVFFKEPHIKTSPSHMEFEIRLPIVSFKQHIVLDGCQGVLETGREFSEGRTPIQTVEMSIYDNGITLRNPRNMTGYAESDGFFADGAESLDLADPLCLFEARILHEDRFGRHGFFQVLEIGAGIVICDPQTQITVSTDIASFVLGESVRHDGIRKVEQGLKKILYPVIGDSVQV